MKQDTDEPSYKLGYRVGFNNGADGADSIYVTMYSGK